MKMVKKTVIAVQIILMSILVSACSSTGSTETPEKAEENMSETEELSENMGEAAEEAGEEIGDEYADLPERFYRECREHCASTVRYMIKEAEGLVYHKGWGIYAPVLIGNRDERVDA